MIHFTDLHGISCRTFAIDSHTFIIIHFVNKITKRNNNKLISEITRNGRVVDASNCIVAR